MLTQARVRFTIHCNEVSNRYSKRTPIARTSREPDLGATHALSHSGECIVLLHGTEQTPRLQKE